MIFFYLAFTLVAGAAAAADDSTLTLFKVNKGHCMDGTPAAYYFRPSPSSSTVWMISLEGGGACYDKTTCTSRSTTALGSSKNYPPQLKQMAAGWMSSSKTVNPDFYDANIVYVPYCSSDTHRGQQNTTSQNTFGFYFSGHLNLIEIVKDITEKQSPSWNSMTKMLLTGGSAGGIGTIYNADWLKTMLPTNALLKAAPLGGWFFPGNYADQVQDNRDWSPPSLYPDFIQHKVTDHTLQSVFVNELWKPIISKDCAIQNVNQEYICGTVHVAYHFVKTPLYIMENMYDTNQITAQGKLPTKIYDTAQGMKYIQYFGIGMRNSTSLLKKGDGIFLSSCLEHTKGLHIGGTTSINGTKLSGSILGDWFFDRPNPNLITKDSCDVSNNDLPCNPSCRNIHPGPGPSPGPSPSGECSDELEKDCPRLKYGTPMKCGQCAKSHRSDLEGAGCTVKSVTALCEARIL